jgi:competence protein ComEC
MKLAWFYVASISFTGGIFLQSFTDLNWPEISLLLVIGCGMGLIGWHSRSISSSNFLPLIVLSVIGFSLGLARLEYATNQEVNSLYEAKLGQTITLTGVISREPEIRDQSTHLYIKVDEELFLVTTDKYTQYQYGEQVSLTGELQKPDRFTTDLGRVFNYPLYLQAKGVTYTVPFAQVQVLAEGYGNPFITRILESKTSFLLALEQQLIEPQVGLAEGLLLGVKRALGEDLENIFRETGIIHIVVLSGYNIMIVVTFITFILSQFLQPKWQVAFGILAIVIFAVMVGLSATVVRASIMASLLLLVQLTGRQYFALRGLLLAGIVMLVINPYLLVFDTGFQLSFLATLGLILLSPILISKLTWVPSLFKAREFLVATIATQIMVLPLLLYQIGQFSVVSVIVNVLVLPMVPVAMLLTFFTGLASILLPPLALPLSYLTHLSLSYIIILATWFSQLPFSAFVVPAFPWWFMAVIYAGLGYFLHWYYQTRLNSPVTQKHDSESLAGWIIEDEAELKVKQIKSNQSSDTPIFFR